MWGEPSFGRGNAETRGSLHEEQDRSSHAQTHEDTRSDARSVTSATSGGAGVAAQLQAGLQARSPRIERDELARNDTGAAGSAAPAAMMSRPNPVPSPFQNATPMRR